LAPHDQKCSAGRGLIIIHRPAADSLFRCYLTAMLTLMLMLMMMLMRMVM